jgi:hypothetical protein
MRCTGGVGVHVPLRTCGCGRYIRRISLNVSDIGAAGAGSQFDSLSVPGFAFCI